MVETETDPDPETFSERRGSHPNSRANLVPAWTHETAPRNGGKPAGQVKAELERRLNERARGSKRTWTERIVDRWVRDAARGNGYARQQILDRMFPVPKDLERDGKVVLQALTLQLGGQTTQVFQAEHGARPSFALEPESESHPGGRAQEVPLLSEGSAESSEVVQESQDTAQESPGSD